MTILRGDAVVEEIKQNAQKRKESAPGRQVWGLQLKDGESTILYFRGFFPCEHDMDEFPDPEDVADLDEEEMQELADDIGACQWDEMTDEHRAQSIARRLKGDQTEPVIWVRHYAERNKGRRGVEVWSNCGDPSARAKATTWNYDTTCRVCYAVQNNDKGASVALNFAWSVYDTRRQHRHKADKKGERDEYTTCTMKAKGFCRTCSANKKIDDRDPDDISGDDLKKLVETTNYATVRDIGMRVLHLSPSDAPLVTALAKLVRTQYCRCGEGRLKIEGACCGNEDCQEELDFDELCAAGWDPENPTNMEWECEDCEEETHPEPVLECTECEEPESARLGDVPIRVTMSKGAKKNTWSFAIDGPAEIIEFGDDDEFDRMLGARLVQWEGQTKEPTPAEQLKWLGQQDDPLGEVEGESDDVADAPSAGKRKKKKKKKKKKDGKSGFLGRG